MIRKKNIPLLVVFIVLMTMSLTAALATVQIFQSGHTLWAGVVTGLVSAAFSTVAYVVLRTLQEDNDGE